MSAWLRRPAALIYWNLLKPWFMQQVGSRERPMISKSQGDPPGNYTAMQGAGNANRWRQCSSRHSARSVPTQGTVHPWWLRNEPRCGLREETSAWTPARQGMNGQI